MGMRSDRGTRRAALPGDRSDPRGFVQALLGYLEHRRVRGHSEQTLDSQLRGLRRFVLWCEERGVKQPSEVTRPLLEAYQRHLYHTPGARGRMLKLQTQSMRLGMVRSFFGWMAKTHLLPNNPASELDLPQLPRTLPRRVLNAEEAERLMVVPDIKTPLGLRDRAILETLYSTGLRRSELVALELVDVDHERSVVWVRHGKGGKQRVVPLGSRALGWIEKYLAESRPRLLDDWASKTLFLGRSGEELTADWLSKMVSRYVEGSGLEGEGSCHMLRHTMATGMLENGADIRFIQEMLGHEHLSTTQIYTRVSLAQLQRVHKATHPAELARAGRKEQDEQVLGELEPEE